MQPGIGATCIEQLVGFALLDDPAALHHHDAVGEFLSETRVSLAR